MRAALPVGLEPFYRCSIPGLKSLDLQVTLAYYDRSKPVVVQTDASEYGLGTYLLQGGWPIAFASKTLTDVETHYANIKRVSFSLLWSGEIPHLYLWEACNYRE